MHRGGAAAGPLLERTLSSDEALGQRTALHAELQQSCESLRCRTRPRSITTPHKAWMPNAPWRRCAYDFISSHAACTGTRMEAPVLTKSSRYARYTCSSTHRSRKGSRGSRMENLQARRRFTSALRHTTGAHMTQRTSGQRTLW